MALSNRPPVVMISSTARDLPEHRRHLESACLREFLFPRMMEDLPAQDVSAVAKSLAMVDEADIYLGIFAFRYGWVPKGETRSITQMEYERAVDRGIPRLIFLMSDDHPVKPGDVETGAGARKLKALKRRLRSESDLIIEEFDSPGDLRAKAISSLAEVKRRLEAEAAERAAREGKPSPDPAVVDLYRKRAEEAEQIERRRRKEDRALREIQQALFPRAAPPLEGFDIAGASFPAGAAGGDYFDFIPMSDGSVGVVIGDVSGHGLGAALLMASMRATVRGVARIVGDIVEILTHANRALVDDFHERFASLLWVRLNSHAGSLIYANAGHPPGHVLDASGRIKATLEVTGELIGIYADANYGTGATIALEPGDLILMVTDGLLETRAPDDSPFGTFRALDVTRAHRGRSAREIVEAIFTAIRDFGRGTPQIDDIAVVVIKVGPAPRP